MQHSNHFTCQIRYVASVVVGASNNPSVPTEASAITHLLRVQFKAGCRGGRTNEWWFAAEQMGIKMTNRKKEVEYRRRLPIKIRSGRNDIRVTEEKSY